MADYIATHHLFELGVALNARELRELSSDGLIAAKAITIRRTQISQIARNVSRE